MVSMEIILQLVSLKAWTLLQGSLNTLDAIRGFLCGSAKGWSEPCLDPDRDICLLCLQIPGPQRGGDLVAQLPVGVPSPGLSYTTHSSHWEALFSF